MVSAQEVTQVAVYTSQWSFYTSFTLYFIIPRAGSSTQLTENRTTLDLSFLISPDVSTNSIVKVFIAVWRLSGFSKKCVDEKTSVERSQSRTGNSIVRGILQVSVIIPCTVLF